MKFSVIIPTLNEELYLPRLLSSIQNQSLKPLEVIIADAESRDNTKRIAEEFGAIIIEGGHPGIGRNNGALIAKYELLVFMDADTVPYDPDFFKKILVSFCKKNLDFASCSYKNFPDNKFKGRVIVFITNLRKIINRITIRCFNKVVGASGGFLIIKKSVFDGLKGFDIKLKNYEDTEFVTRAIKNGYKFDLLPYSVLVSSRRYEKKSWWTLFKILVNLSIYKVFINRQKGQSDKRLEEYEKLKGEMGGGS